VISRPSNRRRPADDGEDLAPGDVEGDAVDGLDAAEVDREVVGLEQAHRRRSDFM
jgi:hypothetical protein